MPAAWIPYVGGALASLGVGVWLTLAIYAGPRLEAANAEIEAARTEAALLGDKMAHQNEAVAALEAEGKARSAAAAKAVAAAQAKADAANRAAADILALPRPEPVDECRQASALIRKELRQ